MKKTAASMPISICHHDGKHNRFFGKYKDEKEPDASKRWKKIPGGPFPEEVNTPEKATACARRWYELEMARRLVPASAGETTKPSWPDVCDAFHKDVDARIRGADASRDELKKRATFLRASALLCSRPVAEHDEDLALAWLRQMLSEPMDRKGREKEPRDPLTVRNIRRVLSEIYKFAQRRKYFPATRRLPTENEEFKAELAGALKEKAKLGKLARVACPLETARAIVTCSTIPALRRVMTCTSLLTGMRPGEAHGLRLSDYREEHGVLLLDVHAQWTLPRKGYPSKVAPTKTVWARRKIPVHPALETRLDGWIAEGWKNHVGRDPKPDDFLFPDETGAPFREERCEQFLSDVEHAGAARNVQGVSLDVYSLRHTFATMARRSGIPSDARDRLLGHRPKDTKSMHYEDEDLPLLAAEMLKISDPFVEPEAVSGRPLPLASRRVTKPPTLVRDLVRPAVAGGGGTGQLVAISAEEMRFELMDPLPDRRFSKPAADARIAAVGAGSEGSCQLACQPELAAAGVASCATCADTWRASCDVVGRDASSGPGTTSPACLEQRIATLVAHRPPSHAPEPRGPFLVTTYLGQLLISSGMGLDPVAIAGAPPPSSSTGTGGPGTFLRPPQTPRCRGSQRDSSP